MKTRAFVLAICLATSLSAQNDLVEQGSLALQHGDYDRAIELLERAIAAQPRNADAHYYLGGAYGNSAQGAGMFKAMSLAGKAKEQLETAVQLDPNHLRARAALVDFYLQAPAIMGGSRDKAVEQANEIRKRDAMAGHRAMARIHTYDKKPDLTIAEMQAEVKEFPNNPRAYYDIGVTYIFQKNFKQATEAFEKSLKVDPNYMPSWFQIGHMAVLNNTNLERGEEALHKYLAYTPKGDEPPIYRAHYWLGGIYEKQGKKSEAKASYTTSLRLNPKQKDVAEALKKLTG